jgi:hypothetical protein
MTLTLGSLTLNLFHHLCSNAAPAGHRDAYILVPGWLMLEWRDWTLEVHHDPEGWIARLVARLGVPVVPAPV